VFIATVVVSALLAAILLVSARGKLVHDPMQMKVMSRVGFPEAMVWLLATAEAAGAAGLVIGLFWWPLGVAAAAGVIAYFAGATGAHLRVGAYDVIAPAALLAAGLATLVLRLLSS
jgi:hypothetical protein